MYRCRRKLLNAEKMLQQTLLIHQLAMLRFNIILVLVLQIPYLKILASTEAKQSKMLIRMILGYAYPAFECFKTVEKNKVEIEDLRFWCRYWILVAIVTVLEKLLHMLVSWVPMYAEMKLALFIYLWYPKTKEASYYKYHVEELVNSGSLSSDCPTSSEFPR